MRSRVPLALMEQMVMLLVFALAAALCLRAFVASDGLSRDSEDRDRAAILCQNAAEAVRRSKGDLERTAELLGLSFWPEGDVEFLSLGYDRDWNSFGVVREIGKDVLRTVRVTPVDSGVDGLGRARVEAFAWTDGNAAENRLLYKLEVCWQETETVTEPKAAAEGAEIDDGGTD